MNVYSPSLIQQFAVEARLNGYLDPAAYDAVFPGFKLGTVINGTAFIWTASERAAAVIAGCYHELLVSILGEIMCEPILDIAVLPVNFPF